MVGRRCTVPASLSRRSGDDFPAPATVPGPVKRQEEMHGCLVRDLGPWRGDWADSVGGEPCHERSRRPGSGGLPRSPEHCCPCRRRPWRPGPPASVIASGWGNACALLAGGAAACWGSNYYGELGDGAGTDRPSPVAVSGISGATAITAGGEHACAVLAGGSVACSGFNRFGELGDGTWSTHRVPVAVSGISGATSVSAGLWHTCALLSGGSVACWGRNTWGTLGDGTHTDRNSPVTVGGISGATAIAAGGYLTCALLAGGGVDCWGTTSSVGWATGPGSTVPIRSP